MCFFHPLYIFFYSAFQVTAPRVIINLVKMKFLPFFNAIPLMSVLMPALVTLMPLVTIQAQEVTSANVKRDSPETEPIVLVSIRFHLLFSRPEFLKYSVLNTGFTRNGTHCSRKYISFHLLFPTRILEVFFNNSPETEPIVLVSISAFICFFSTGILGVFF